MEEFAAPIIRSLEITMPSRFGFHLRVAGRFIRCVRQFHSAIRVRKGKTTVDGKNILSLLLLAAAWKSKLTIEAEGADAEEAINGIRAFFQTEKE